MDPLKTAEGTGGSPTCFSCILNIVIQRQRCRPNIRPTIVGQHVGRQRKKQTCRQRQKSYFVTFNFDFARVTSFLFLLREYFFNVIKKGLKTVFFSNLILQVHFWPEMTFFDLSVLSFSDEYLLSADTRKSVVVGSLPEALYGNPGCD
jgi:hypothetical protein